MTRVMGKLKRCWEQPFCMCEGQLWFYAFFFPRSYVVLWNQEQSPQVMWVFLSSLSICCIRQVITTPWIKVQRCSDIHNKENASDGTVQQSARWWRQETKVFLKSPVSQKMLAVEVCISKVGLGCENCRCIWYPYW